MSVAKHRWAAGLVLATGVVGLLAWGQYLRGETAPIREARDRLRGTWVARAVQATEHGKTSGAEAAGTTIRFDGRTVVLRNRVEGGDATGTYLIDPTTNPPRFDLMLDRGWTIGTYRLEGDTLAIAVNPLMLPEQLGVPTRGRPREAGPAFGRYYYSFRKATP